MTPENSIYRQTDTGGTERLRNGLNQASTPDDTRRVIADIAYAGEGATETNSQKDGIKIVEAAKESFRDLEEKGLTASLKEIRDFLNGQLPNLSEICSPEVFRLANLALFGKENPFEKVAGGSHLTEGISSGAAPLLRQVAYPKYCGDKAQGRSAQPFFLIPPTRLIEGYVTLLQDLGKNENNPKEQKKAVSEFVLGMLKESLDLTNGGRRKEDDNLYEADLKNPNGPYASVIVTLESMLETAIDKSEGKKTGSGGLGTGVESPPVQPENQPAKATQEKQKQTGAGEFTGAADFASYLQNIYQAEGDEALAEKMKRFAKDLGEHPVFARNLVDHLNALVQLAKEAGGMDKINFDVLNSGGSHLGAITVESIRNNERKKYVSFQSDPEQRPSTAGKNYLGNTQHGVSLYNEGDGLAISENGYIYVDKDAYDFFRDAYLKNALTERS